MKPIDFRNETFEQLKGRLAGLREKVWLAWTAYEVRHGTAGATTRQVAAWSKIDILTFRPRSTELYQLGALMVVPIEFGPAGSEGYYRVRSDAEWQAWHQAQQTQLTINQLQLV